MPLTSIDGVYLNREDYSRYNDAARYVRARVLFTPDDGGGDGETLTAKLYRDGGWLIAEKSHTLSGEYPKGYVFEFDLESDCTMEPKAGEIFNNARFGQYYIEVENPSGPDAISQKFWVMPVTADELRKTRLFGMTLSAAEILAPVEQPKSITGVTINIVSDFMSKGVHSLAWDASEETLTLTSSHDLGPYSPTGGTAVKITPEQRIYVITDSTVVSGEEYLICDVDYFELPGADKTEDIFIDNMRLGDEYLRFFIREAYGAVRRDLQVPLEPTWITTDRTIESEWHEYRQPVEFERAEHGVKFISIETALNRMLYMHELTGKLNDGTVVTIPDEWRVEYHRDGLVNLVPQSGAMLQWLSYGVGYWWLNRYGHIPAFWHFYALCGLPHMREEFDPVRAAINRFCALEVMIKAGSAYRAGFSSESVGRDGISASQSYTSSATFGIYSADQEELKKWRDTEWKRFKNSIRGPRITLL